MKNKNKQFRELARQAAQFEKDGVMSSAAVTWFQAMMHSKSKENREWCELRAQFCQAMRWHR